jgi:hypothetical protein
MEHSVSRTLAWFSCGAVKVKKRLRWLWAHHVTHRRWAWENWRKGYMRCAIQRCRECTHTTPFHYPACSQYRSAS